MLPASKALAVGHRVQLRAFKVDQAQILHGDLSGFVFVVDVVMMPRRIDITAIVGFTAARRAAAR
jgi:hypothetical protein